MSIHNPVGLLFLLPTLAASDVCSDRGLGYCAIQVLSGFIVTLGKALDSCIHV